jgi:hypothetical protein
MSDLLLDTVTNDLSVVSGDLVIVDKDAAIRQRLLETLRLFLGEWFLDTSKGLPYYQSILIKNPNLDVIEGLLRNAILNTDGVEQLTEFTFNYSSAGRTLSVSFQAQSSNGTLIKVQTQIGKAGT